MHILDRSGRLHRVTGIRQALGRIGRLFLFSGSLFTRVRDVHCGLRNSKANRE